MINLVIVYNNDDSFINLIDIMTFYNHILACMSP